MAMKLKAKGSNRATVERATANLVHAASTLASAISSERQKLKMSQQALAELLGVSQSAITDWERGVNRPKFELWPKLTEVLGLNPSIFHSIEVAERHRDHVEPLPASFVENEFTETGEGWKKPLRRLRLARDSRAAFQFLYEGFKQLYDELDIDEGSEVEFAYFVATKWNLLRTNAIREELHEDVEIPYSVATVQKRAEAIIADFREKFLELKCET